MPDAISARVVGEIKPPVAGSPRRPLRRVLLAASPDSTDTVGELPRVLRQAGLHVTLLCARETRPFVSSRHNIWIESPREPAAIMDKLVALLQDSPGAYDWVILGDDHLLYALTDAPLSPALKTRIGAVGNPEHLALPGSKIGSATFCAQAGVNIPASAACATFSAAAAAADAIGFPVMIKIDRSSGGAGVFLCETPADLHAHRPRFEGRPVLVEKYIAGDMVCVEPLYREGQLLAYAYSTAAMNLGIAVSCRRHYEPCPALRAPLERIGQGLRLSGFCNLTFIRDAGGAHYLVELDVRPNAWVACGRLAGVDFAQAIRAWRKQRPYEQAPRRTLLSLYHREVAYFITRQHEAGLRYWKRNENKCWRTIPFHDPRLLWAQTMEFARPEFRRWRRERLYPWLSRKLRGKQGR